MTIKELNQSCDTALDAEWRFRLDAVDMLNEIAEEKGSKILAFKMKVYDPFKKPYSSMTLSRVEIRDENAEFYTTRKKNNSRYYVGDFEPDAMVEIVRYIKKNGKPIK